MKKWIITSIIIFIIMILLFIYYACYNPFLSIKLKGKDKIVLEVNTIYNELGATIKGTKSKYKISNKVNTTKLGKYKLIYTISVLNTTRSVERIITVVDTTNPEIVLKGGDIAIYEGEEYKEPGFTVTDNYDVDIVNKIVVNSNVDNKKKGEYLITYEVADSSGNMCTKSRKVTVKEKEKKEILPIKTKTVASVNTYIKGILLVNKKYSLSSDYNPGVNSEAYSALLQMQSDASLLGYNLSLKSGFRSYREQVALYNYYVSLDGESVANTYSARPGQSEHQTGLAFDVGQISDSFGDTQSGIWLASNCYKYGFIIRYPKEKQNITGYKYEPWHIRYVGINDATSIYNMGITLEEYLGVN